MMTPKTELTAGSLCLHNCAKTGYVSLIADEQTFKLTLNCCLYVKEKYIKYSLPHYLRLVRHSNRWMCVHVCAHTCKPTHIKYTTSWYKTKILKVKIMSNSQSIKKESEAQNDKRLPASSGYSESSYLQHTNEGHNEDCVDHTHRQGQTGGIYRSSRSWASVGGW